MSERYVIEVDGLVGKVVQIDFRTTMVVTRDDKYIIVPNTDLTKNPSVTGLLVRLDCQTALGDVKTTEK